jgi:glycosyltransferase involved in cell wall biosynthesis
LNIIIVHHHLLTGGVTKVINTQIESLKEIEGIKVHLLCGDYAGYENDDVGFFHCPEINYLKSSDTQVDLDKTLNIIDEKLNQITNILENPVFHIHNLNLGKNPILNLAFYNLSKNGVPIFNHCHDFAEDNRPKNMEWLKEVVEIKFKKSLEETLYPIHSNLEYGVINEGDKKLLSKHPSTHRKVNFVPNAILPPPLSKDCTNKDSVIRGQLGINNDLPIIVYPVRVIERKNIAELILLTLLFKDKANWCVTQPPKNPDEIVNYEIWKQLCKDLQIPLIFEAGDLCDFNELMYSADRIITTSSKEGFGLTFLEPWLYEKAVIGRNLPDITKDFKSQNINLNLLYDQLKVDNKDFIDYTETEKANLIVTVAESKEKATQIIKNNNLDKLLLPIKKSLIDKNKQAIQSSYSVKSYGKNLASIYERLTQSN